MVRKRASRKTAGFTLVEVVVACTLVSIVMMGVATYGLVASRSLIKTRKTSVATVLAHQTLDSLRQRKFAELGLAATTKSMNTGTFTFSIISTIAAGDTLNPPRLKTITVQVVDNTGKEIQRLRSAIYIGDQ